MGKMAVPSLRAGVLMGYTHSSMKDGIKCRDCGKPLMTYKEIDNEALPAPQNRLIKYITEHPVFYRWVWDKTNAKDPPTSGYLYEWLCEDCFNRRVSGE